MKLVLVKIDWVDAGIETIQLPEEEALSLTPMPRCNVGFLLVNNKEKVILCFGHISDRERHGQVWDTTMVIPKGIVKKITYLVEKINGNASNSKPT